MLSQEIKSETEATLFLVSDMIDVQIAVSKVSKPLFIKEASATDRSLIGTIVSELGSNIIKYAGRGQIKIAQISREDAVDVEIWAKDQGPGIVNVSLAMKDHFTTGNTLGLGLPGVKRMADDFMIKSEIGSGTSVYARKRIYIKKDDANIIKVSSTTNNSLSITNDTPWEAGFYNRPIIGEYLSGDSVTVVEFDHYILLSIVDVSGHGAKAHELSVIISDYIRNFPSENLVQLLTELHKILNGTLGAAVGLLLIDAESATFQYVGIGNTGAVRSVGEPWKGISRDGILGGQRLPSPYPQVGVLSNGDVFCMWSDGISDHARNDFFKKNSFDSAQKIATNLVIELGKQHDDASCIIFKWLA